MMLYIRITLFFTTLSILSFGQRQAGKAYEFLDLPSTARSVSIGGNHATLGVEESGFIFQNPAIIRDTLSGAISLNVTPLPAGMVHGSAAYIHKIEGIGTFGAGVQYINYGQFDRTDENWNELGTFGAQEAALYICYARQMTPTLHLGATIKPIFSKLENYGSFGIAMDMGAYYRAQNGRINAGIVLRNFGAQVTTYNDDSDHQNLNTDIRIGVAYKLEHAPFRFSLTLKDLFNWDISTNNDNKISAGDNIMRHILFGVEFVPIRNFFVGFGYNQRQRKETRSPSSGGAAGFSWGFGLRICKIDIAYGCGRYHLAGSANSISISTNLNRFL